MQRQKIRDAKQVQLKRKESVKLVNAQKAGGKEPKRFVGKRSQKSTDATKRKTDARAKGRQDQESKEAPWQIVEESFTQSNEQTEQLQRELVLFYTVLQKIRPLKESHRRSLGEDIQALSKILTNERFLLHRPYWSSPSAISAYFYYFLPWNILRFLPLLRGLESRLAPLALAKSVLIDLGSGPLTMPIALWLSFPKLRSVPLTIIAQDRSSQPLELGYALLEALSNACNMPLVWRIHRVTSPLNRLKGAVAALEEADLWERPWLVCACNLLNEIVHEEAEHNVDEEAWESTEAKFLQKVGVLLEEREAQTQLLFVEPGTRLGGKILQRMRLAALERDLHPLWPCPHEGLCPLQEGRGRRTWCHFTFEVGFVPEWLSNLSRTAGLAKQTLSLAPLLLATHQGPHRRFHPGNVFARILSEPFSVPMLTGKARYACSEAGLLLLEQAQKAWQASGVRVDLTHADTMAHDAKSGALVVKRGE